MSQSDSVPISPPSPAETPTNTLSCPDCGFTDWSTSFRGVDASNGYGPSSSAPATRPTETQTATPEPFMFGILNSRGGLVGFRDREVDAASDAGARGRLYPNNGPYSVIPLYRFQSAPRAAQPATTATRQKRFALMLAELLVAQSEVIDGKHAGSDFGPALLTRERLTLALLAEFRAACAGSAEDTNG